MLAGVNAEAEKKSNATKHRVMDAGFCPDGTNENSPAFQRRVWADRRLSPEGTAELVVLSRPFGTWHAQATVPALKRWAIVSHPSGMTALKS